MSSTIDTIQLSLRHWNRDRNTSVIPDERRVGWGEIVDVVNGEGVRDTIQLSLRHWNSERNTSVIPDESAEGFGE